MSSVFKKPKVKYIQPTTVEPNYTALNEVSAIDDMQEIEKKRKRKMGALSQMLSHDNSYEKGKTLLGE